MHTIDRLTDWLHPPIYFTFFFCSHPPSSLSPTLSHGVRPPLGRKHWPRPTRGRLSDGASRNTHARSVGISQTSTHRPPALVLLSAEFISLLGCSTAPSPAIQWSLTTKFRMRWPPTTGRIPRTWDRRLDKPRTNTPRPCPITWPRCSPALPALEVLQPPDMLLPLRCGSTTWLRHQQLRQLLQLGQSQTRQQEEEQQGQSAPAGHITKRMVLLDLALVPPPPPLPPPLRRSRFAAECA